ncbi:MAG: murein hydrolase activator EnvC, partial [Alphaproteobacteria bacterium]
MPALAQNKPEIKEIDRKLGAERANAAKLSQKTQELVKDVAKIKKSLVDAADKAQKLEHELSFLETELSKLEDKEKTYRDDFATRQQQLAQILSMIERISLHPPETLIAFPGDANDTVRSALLLRAMVPQLEKRAVMLRNELHEVAALRANIQKRRARSAQANADLIEQRVELENLLRQQSDMLSATEKEKSDNQARLAALNAQAKTMRDLLDKIEQERVNRTPDKPGQTDANASRTATLSKPTALRKFSDARGHLLMPASGAVVRQFGEDAEFGQQSKGIVIQTRKGARVVAPFDGQVVFAGAFRGYGQILIVEHSEGYHSLIAGISRIDVSVKQYVLAGEPVGLMGDGPDTSLRLYLEIRQRGRPINPLPWLAADKRKV